VEPGYDGQDELSTLSMSSPEDMSVGVILFPADPVADVSIRL
jgi:hypothetical protein